VCIFQSHNFYKEAIAKQSTNLVKSQNQWCVMCFWAKKALPLFDGKYELWNKICKWLSDLTDWVCAQQVVKFQVWRLHEGPSTLPSQAFGFKAKLYYIYILNTYLVVNLQNVLNVRIRLYFFQAIVNSSVVQILAKICFNKSHQGFETKILIQNFS
jgi:hypothetical protein